MKYKDIYSLLSTKQYEAAEPFLRQYLAGERGNPNAYLFMGIIYQEKAAAYNVLRETGPLLACADSAIQCFDKAALLLTERELKRNAAYYQAYNRRDLRTGEFGLAMSDIQFDLQKRKEALVSRAAAAKMIRHHFVAADSLYVVCTRAYRSLQEQYPSKRDLLLRATDTTLAFLDDLSSQFNATMQAIRLYQSSMRTPGIQTYRHEFNLRSITGYPIDGIELSDFYAEDVMIWDYGTFAGDVRAQIVNDILPLQEETLRLLAALSDLERDSTSNRDAMLHPLPFDDFKPYDNDPLPLSLARLRIAAMEFRNTTERSSAQADSLDVDFQLQLAVAEASALEKVDSLAGLLRQRDLSDEVRVYVRFLPREVRTRDAVESLIDDLSAAVDSQRTRVRENLVTRRGAVGRIRVGDELIPMHGADTRCACQPLLTVGERYTVGLKAIDSVNVAGYFYSITPSRIPDVSATFSLDSASFGPARWPSLRALSADSNGLVYYVLIYSTEPGDEKYAAKVAKIYRGDGLSWTVDFQLGFVPETLEYQAETGSLAVQGQGTLIIDKNGNAR